MNELWSALTNSITPYIPGEQPKNIDNLVKLNTNENPYPPAPAVFDAIKGAVNSSLRLYPDCNATCMIESLVRFYNIKYPNAKLDDSNFFIGNGSDEVLAFALRAFYGQERPLNMNDITYSFYTVYCDLFQIPYVIHPLKEDFTIDVDSFVNAKGGVIITNPNAPTGIYLDIESIKKILDNHKKDVVIIDEAYIDFGGTSCADLVCEYDNLLIITTLSKSRSLAGLRVGYAYGNKSLIEGLNVIKNSFNSYTMDRIAQAAGAAAIDNWEYYDIITDKIIEDREILCENLAKMGFITLPSSANFIFTTHPDYHAKDIYDALRRQGVIVRYFNKPRISEYLRITIGDKEQNIRIVEALNKEFGL